MVVGRKPNGKIIVVISRTNSKVKIVGVYFMNTGHEMKNEKKMVELKIQYEWYRIGYCGYFNTHTSTWYQTTTCAILLIFAIFLLQF